jgi:hypothetical protein
MEALSKAGRAFEGLEALLGGDNFALGVSPTTYIQGVRLDCTM